jgi:cytochrome c
MKTGTFVNIRMSAAALLAALMVLSMAACAAQPDTLQTEPVTVPGGDPARGAQALADYGCGSCHTIPGVHGADALVGPPLNAWAERRFIAGTLANQPENLIEWIRFPQSIEPGTAMPDLGVEEADARDMSAYLFSLRRQDRSGWWPFGSGNR